jgi:hypothetical protein
MRARKFVTPFGYAASLSLFLVIWSALLFVTVGAENSPPAKSDVGSLAKISRESTACARAREKLLKNFASGSTRQLRHSCQVIGPCGQAG